MSVNMNEILKKLDRGDISSDQALEEIQIDRHQNKDYNDYFLRVQVSRMDNDQVRVHLRIPLRMLKAGLDIGAVYAPELRDLDLQQIIRDLQTCADGSILEVEDFESGERVLISIDRIED